MTKHLLGHLRQNTIAYFALFVALGGTSYASVKIPQHVAAPTAAKSAKAGITCGGACPASTVYWAYIGALGNPGAANFGSAASTPYQSAVGGVPAQILKLGLGDWMVYFQGLELTNCVRLANLVHSRGSATVSGYDHFNDDPTGIHVMTTNAAGQPADLDFAVVALCGKAKGITKTPAPPASGTRVGAAG
jgi:hypothetical protein